MVKLDSAKDYSVETAKKIAAQMVESEAVGYFAAAEYFSARGINAVDLHGVGKADADSSKATAVNTFLFRIKG